MRGTLQRRIDDARELQGRFCQGRENIVPPFKFSGCARHLWPHKTAAHLAAIGRKDERTAKRWLAGEFEPPAVVFAAMLTEMLKREGD